MKKKHLKNIMQHQLEEQASKEIAMNSWIVERMPQAVPSWLSGFFRKAILGKWNRVLELIIWLYSLEIRFAKDGNIVLNVAIFKKGEMFDSWIKQDSNVVDINSIRRNGHEKEKITTD